MNAPQNHFDLKMGSNVENTVSLTVNKQNTEPINPKLLVD